MAREFLAEIRRALQLIEEFPGAGAAVPYLDDAAIRRFPVRRFPYQIVYVDLTEIIEIVAIASDYRRPGYWQER